MGDPDIGGTRRRVLSSLVLIPVTLALVYLGGAALAALVALVLSAAALEWDRMANGIRWGVSSAVTAAVISGTLAALLLVGPTTALIVAGGGAALAFLAGLITRAHPIGSGAGALALSAAGIAFLWLRADSETGRAMIFWLLAVVWAGDVGGYFLGRALGGLRLAPRLSPAKTWAGAVGGMIAALLAGAFMGWLLARVGWLPAMPVLSVLILGSLALSLAAQAGDLGESALKRRFAVKDSGRLIPGHGGVLDRLDSLLAAAPVLALAHLAAGSPLLTWR